MESWKPDVVVGVDFGMTCTGIAFSSKPAWAEPKVLQKWPRRLAASELANKVPSKISYDANDNARDWGFLCNFDEPGLRIQDWFKLYLDPAFIDTWHDRPSREEAARFYQDYMRFLHQHLEAHFRRTVPGWSTKHAEYIFSIPTTWRNPALTEELEDWLEQAGFTQDPSRRRINIARTEAEAAAVYAAKQYYDVNDVVMVVDAGGGTTDINILKVTTRTYEKTHLKALNKAEGINAGSALIDWQAKQLIRDQVLAMTGNQDQSYLQGVADELTRDHFEAFKCTFGTTGTSLDLHMPIPGAANHVVIITANQVKALFDRQIEEIFAKVDEQIRALQTEYPTEQLNYIVLSGGLGSSPYVQTRLRGRYSSGAPFPNARFVEVLCADEPQLAVAKGLVMDRVQALHRGVGVYTGMCCRTSYGVICRRPYDEIEHRGERVTIDPLDGMKWAEDQIDWLIKEGQPVPQDGLHRPYRLKIPVGRESQMWQAQIVMSESPARDLPQSIRFENVRNVCTIFSHFERRDFQRGNDRTFNPFKLKNKSMFSSKKKYYTAEFDVKVLVGSTDLKFQLVSKDGRKYSQNHDQITVRWEEATADPSTTSNMGRMYPVE